MASIHTIFRGEYPDISKPVGERRFETQAGILFLLNQLVSITGHAYWTAGITDDYIQVSPKQRPVEAKQRKVLYNRRQHPMFDIFKKESDENQAAKS